MLPLTRTELRSARLSPKFALMVNTSHLRGEVLAIRVTLAQVSSPFANPSSSRPVLLAKAKRGVAIRVALP